MKTEACMVNAFTAKGDGGNPAGVVLDASGLSESQMQLIAQNIGASETAFVLPDNAATHRLRFFTPTQEVPLCGHATIATWSMLYQSDFHAPGIYSQNTLDGAIGVEIMTDGKIFMEQPTQIIRELVDPVVAANVLHVELKDLSTEIKPQLVQRQLMVCLKSINTLEALQPDLKMIEKVSSDLDFFGVHVFVLLDNSDLLASVRNFCPRVGIDEDAATGTANGSLLEFLKARGHLPNQQMYKIEQGKAMGRLSHIYGKFENDHIWIGGEAKQVSKLALTT